MSDPQQPDRQRVLVVGATEWPHGTAQRIEAVQLTLGPPGPIPAADLAARVFEAIKATPHSYEERRAVTNWGAGGLPTQDIEVAFLVGYAANAAASLTVAGVVAGLTSLLHRSEAGPTRPPPPWRADDVWAQVEDFLRRACKVTQLKAHEVTQTSEGWHIKAQGDAFEFDVTVDTDGRTMRARQVGSLDSELGG